MSPWRVTFHPSHVLPWAWQEVEVETFLVNEADYRCCSLLVAGQRKARGRRVCVDKWFAGTLVSLIL